MDAVVAGSRSLGAFLPLYLVASFLKCQHCGNCCRPNQRQWDKGVVLSKEEAVSLGSFCVLKKSGSTYLLEYPCQLLDKENSTCLQYHVRPFGCRAFPFSINSEKKTGDLQFGIIMVCPAGKELYVSSQLFLNELSAFLQTRRKMGIPRFGIKEFETIKNRFEHNSIDEQEMRYMKKLAMSY
jgi:Fe-S-cluster containining protein